MFLTTWGVKPLKQFRTIILKSMNQIIGKKYENTRALKFINQFALGYQLVNQHNNIVFIIVMENYNSINISKQTPI